MSQNERKLLNGDKVLEAKEEIELEIKTKCPNKWLAVDMETGQIWKGDNNGKWRLASDEYYVINQDAIDSARYRLAMAAAKKREGKT